MVVGAIVDSITAAVVIISTLTKYKTINKLSTILAFVNFAVSATILISKQPVPSPPLSIVQSKLDLATVAHYYNLSNID